MLVGRRVHEDLGQLDCGPQRSLLVEVSLVNLPFQFGIVEFGMDDVVRVRGPEDELPGLDTSERFWVFCHYCLPEIINRLVAFNLQRTEVVGGLAAQDPAEKSKFVDRHNGRRW